MITLSNASNKPIYKQITEQLKQQILQGALPAGTALPSIRGLAKELKISTMTTKRVYEDLESDGFIETIAGKGSFVAKRNQDFLREAIITDVEKYLWKAIELAKTANMTDQELTKLLHLLLEEQRL